MEENDLFCHLCQYIDVLIIFRIGCESGFQSLKLIAIITYKVKQIVTNRHRYGITNKNRRWFYYKFYDDKGNC